MFWIRVLPPQSTRPLYLLDPRTPWRPCLSTLGCVIASPSLPFLQAPNPPSHRTPMSEIFFAVLQWLPIPEFTSLNKERNRTAILPPRLPRPATPPGCQVLSTPSRPLGSSSPAGSPLLLEMPLSPVSMKLLVGALPCLLLPFFNSFSSSYRDLNPSRTSVPPMHQRFHVPQPKSGPRA